MSRFTKHGKRLKVLFAASAFGSMLAASAVFPWFGHMDKVSDKLYVVSLSGKEIGICSDIDVVNRLYIEARNEFENKSEDAIYIDSDLEFVEYDKKVGSADSDDTIKEAILLNLKDSTVDKKRQAYVVDIEGLTITLDSKEDVVGLLQAAKAKYDEKGEFDTVLYNDKTSRFEKISYDVVNAAVLEKYSDDVMAAIDSNASKEKNVNSDKIFKEKDHIVNISFEQDINISETYVPSSHIMNLEDAIELVTKEQEKSQVHEVVEGDTLYDIATSYNLSLDEIIAMNPDFVDMNFIRVGDQIKVTVPEPELSVIVTKQETFEEDYELPVQYIENDSLYNTYSNVICEGSTGHRKVVANVEYKDGVSRKVDILAEKVTTEAVARVVEIGTITPPTYILPLSSARISSYYGARWGRMHYGIDYVCSIGTSVMASSGGVVIEAGWNGSFGYTVLISHPDGRQTRYAHLSSIYVAYGQTVNQGQVIAASGNTGNSTGPHLHFEMIVNGVRSNPLDYLY